MASLSSILGGSSVIKSIQRGTIALGGNSSGTVTISPVNMNKAELRHLGTSTNSSELYSALVNMSLSNPSTITVSRWLASGGYATVSFEITEYY